ncbi:hypothetical protein [Verrucosispora sp. TAA-831]|uniref:hypothetical protein n=1 Tax=Verrucosispora sp. TAA-831 TaxID=3422227 RepID=UPI003D6DED1C
MSAYVVGITHIHALLTAGLELRRGPDDPLRWWYPRLDPNAGYEDRWRNLRELTRDSAGRVGAVLLAENMRSVNFRYREDEIEEPYEFVRLPGSPNPLVVLKALDGYEYQACEHAEWGNSEAAAFCEALRHRAIGYLPGYSASPGWEITDPNVFQARRAQRS